MKVDFTLCMDKEKSAAKTGVSLIALLVLTIALCVTAIKQYKEKSSLQQENKELILENDSILSANIELRKQLLHAKQIYFSVRTQK